jgi:FMN phosphatase YigB (HAD superfamily)
MMTSDVKYLLSRLFASLRSRLPTGVTGMEETHKWLSRHTRYHVYSFDIFDTLLRRRVDPPELVKQLVAEHISSLLAAHEIHISTDEMLGRRNEVEKALRHEAKLGGRDSQCFLEDVIKETLKAVKADSVLKSEEIVNYEVSLEKKATQPMPGAIEVLTYLKSHGRRVVGLSETYLSLSQITAILEHHSLMQYLDTLYVSSDLGRGKPSGKLFQYIMEREGRGVVHIGDNYYLDYLIPKKLGVRTLWFHSRSEQRRKRKLKKLLDSGNKMEYVNAIVRRADIGSAPVYRIGYEVLGPALTVFVHNVAEQARKDGIEMLFFVARDGYAMKKIYEILQSNIYVNENLPPGKYMCLGRVPVRLASLRQLNHAEISEVRRYMARTGGGYVTLGHILRSYGLETNDFMDIAKRYEIDLGEPIGDLSGDSKLQELLQSDMFHEAVKTRSNGGKKLLRDYLVGIKFMGSRKVAIVDANAEGVTKSLLEHAFVSDKDFPVVYSYYFNLLNLGVGKADPSSDLSQVKGIVSDWRKDSEKGQRPFRLLGLLIEVFAHPNHGLTVGYKNINGKTKPVFRRTPQESQYGITSRGLEGILAYAGDYSTHYGLHNYRAKQLLEHSKADMKRWVLHPPKRDAEALKSLFVTNDWPYERNFQFIADVNLRDVITLRGLIKKSATSAWPEASLTVAPLPALSRVLHKTSVFVGRIRNLLSRLT